MKSVKKIVALLAFSVAFCAQNKITFAQTSDKVAKMWIETSGVAEIQGKTIDVAGWAINKSGVKEVDVSLDGKKIGTTTTNIARGDVNYIYPGYIGGDKSGFKYDIDDETMNPGKHTISVQAVGNDGTMTTQSYTINLNKPSPHMWVETMGQNKIENIDVNVGGWAVNPSGVKEVDISIDGKKLGATTTNIDRGDINKIYPDYQSSFKSGFNYKIDINTLSLGAHTILVQAIGNDGTSSSQSYSITVSKPSPHIWLETASNNDSHGENLNIGGWAVNPSGLKEISVNVDGKNVGTTMANIDRGDVNKIYPGYNGSLKSGFSYKLDVSSITDGKHTILVQAIGNDGTSSSQSYMISVSRMIPRIYVETMSQNMNVNSNFNITGWALNPSGMKEIDIDTDGNLTAVLPVNLPRGDVNYTYPDYPNGGNSGFNYLYNIINLAPGKHTIVVNGVGNDGSNITQSYTISVNNTQYDYYNKSLSQDVDLQMKADPQTDKTGSWTNASRDDVSYYMNASNFFQGNAKLQFLKLNYQDGVTADDLNKILSGKGILNGKGAVFLQAAQQNNINPVYLVSHALLETGNGTSRLSTGIVVNGVTVYNEFGINANDSNPDGDGSQYAYNHGWTTVDKAIYGGAYFISSSYINSSYQQNTLYKMRWNPAFTENHSYASHQYASDVGWAYKQVYNIKKLLDLCPTMPLVFEIPIFKN